MAASSAGRHHQQQQQQSQAASLKSSVTKFARLFLGKSKKEPQQQQQASNGKSTGAAFYHGSLARQPGRSQVTHGGSQRRGSHSRWRSQESLASDEAPEDCAVACAIDNGIMAQSLHAEIGSFGQPVTVSHSVGCIAARRQTAPPPSLEADGALFHPVQVQQRRIAVVDRDEAASSVAGVGEAPTTEAADPVGALRAKDHELELLRLTMEQNEAALLRVFEERRAQLEARLQSERALGADLAPAVAQTNRRLRDSDREAAELRASSARRLAEAHTMRARLRATEAETLAQTELARRLELELAAAGGALDSTTRELRRPAARPSAERACQAAAPLPSMQYGGVNLPEVTVDAATEQLRAEVAQARAALDDQSRRFDSERAQWLTEKRQVVNYQKQLQLNLLQLTRKAGQLEADVKQLAGELAAKEAQIEALLLASGARAEGGGASGVAGSLRGSSQC